MTMADFTFNWLFVPLVAGGLGVAAMELVMWLMTSNGLARGNMVVALGGLLTGERRHAFRVGLSVHLTAGAAFALLYLWGLRSFGMTHFPAVLYASIGFGLFHGMVVSLLLVWVVSDHHPLKEFKGADLAIGLSHFAGHAAFGLTVGLVVGLLSQ
jgi:hypothetical protein